MVEVSGARSLSMPRLKQLRCRVRRAVGGRFTLLAATPVRTNTVKLIRLIF